MMNRQQNRMGDPYMGRSNRMEAPGGRRQSRFGGPGMMGPPGEGGVMNDMGMMGRNRDFGSREFVGTQGYGRDNYNFDGPGARRDFGNAMGSQMNGPPGMRGPGNQGLYDRQGPDGRFGVGGRQRFTSRRQGLNGNQRFDDNRSRGRDYGGYKLGDRDFYSPISREN